MTPHSLHKQRQAFERRHETWMRKRIDQGEENDTPWILRKTLGHFQRLPSHRTSNPPECRDCEIAWPSEIQHKTWPYLQCDQTVPLIHRVLWLESRETALRVRMCFASSEKLGSPSRPWTMRIGGFSLPALSWTKEEEIGRANMSLFAMLAKTTGDLTGHFR